MMPIFMIGTQRSGSNLLRLMLNQLPEIAAPHPPHILQRIMPLVSVYGDLGQDPNFAQLVEDVCRLVELNPVPWEGVKLDRDAIARHCRERSPVALHGAVYDKCAEAKGAATWCCKSLANIKYVSQIESYFRKPKYIYLYRDGRDVAVSFHKAVVGEKHFYHIAREWAATQELALHIRKEMEPGRFLDISYEELTGDPQRTAQDICDYLGLPFRDAMLDYYRTEEARRAASSSELWGNVVNPVMQNNNRKFLREAREEDIRIFEAVAGHVLDALGYDRIFIPRGERVRFTNAEIKAFDAENAGMKEKVLKLIDPADLIRRDLQAGLLKSIGERQALPHVALSLAEDKLLNSGHSGGNRA
ncbi:MAG TPA: sulfotransferase [Nitrospirota bacterium]|nr:sulfotransferase [Nitrospirota bacterium]